MEGDTNEKKTIRLGDLKAKQLASARVISGRYAIGSKSMPGGVSEVYRAVDLGQGNRDVALKLFGQGGTPDEVLHESYRRELQALGDLRHPNIVELLDHGQDADSGRNYLVLEWLEHDLSKTEKEFSGQAWSRFYDAVGRPILQALAFAHSRACVHRDIKPGNILFSKSGVPKLADFGIAKIKRLLSPGVTLAQYATAPFAPPEYDDGSFSYTRDVFGFGVVALVCLSSQSVKRYEDFPQAIRDIRVPKDVRDLLDRALCMDNPGMRPQNAVVLLSQLDQIASRDKKTSPTSRIRVGLTKRAIDHISVELGFNSEAEVTEFVNKDIELARLRPDTQSESVGPRGSVEPTYLLIGGSFSYRVIVDTNGITGVLRAISALRPAPSVIDDMRDDAFEAPYGFVCGPTTFVSPTNDAITELVLRLPTQKYSSVIKPSLLRRASTGCRLKVIPTKNFGTSRDIWFPTLHSSNRSFTSK